MLDLAKKYLSLRAPHALAYAKVHHQGAHPHIHLLISANHHQSPKKIRLSQSRFRKIKKQLEAYQRKHYPALVHSHAQNPSRTRKAGVKEKRREGEEQREKRLNKQKRKLPTRKQKIAKLVSLALTHATSPSDFEKKLANLDLTLYTRGQMHGVIECETGRRHRVATLGLTEAYDYARVRWQRRAERLPRFAQLDRDLIAREVREYEFGKAALALIEVAEIAAEQPQTERGRELKRKRLRLAKIQSKALIEQTKAVERER